VVLHDQVVLHGQVVLPGLEAPHDQEGGHLHPFPNLHLEVPVGKHNVLKEATKQCGHTETEMVSIQIDWL